MVKIPIQFNASIPAEIDVIRIDLDTMREETIKVSRSDVRSIARSIKSLSDPGAAVYTWDYPVYRLMLNFGFTAIIFTILLSLVVHYLSGAIRLQTPGPKITPLARRHLTILVFVFMALKACAYWLDRYGLVLSGRSGKVTGA